MYECGGDAPAKYKIFAALILCYMVLGARSREVYWLPKKQSTHPKKRRAPAQKTRAARVYIFICFFCFHIASGTGAIICLITRRERVHKTNARRLCFVRLEFRYFMHTNTYSILSFGNVFGV